MRRPLPAADLAVSLLHASLPISVSSVVRSAEAACATLRRVLPLQNLAVSMLVPPPATCTSLCGTNQYKQGLRECSGDQRTCAGRPPASHVQLR